jgi:hypothetical protein
MVVAARGMASFRRPALTAITIDERPWGGEAVAAVPPGWAAVGATNKPLGDWFGLG